MFYEKLLITALAFMGPVRSQGGLPDSLTGTEAMPWVNGNPQDVVIANYRQTCLQTWTTVPSTAYDASKLKLMRDYSSSTAWYNQHNMAEISWKMFSDLYETPDQEAWNFQNNAEISTYLANIYEEQLQDQSFVQSILSGNLWEVTKVDTVKETKHWVSQSTQNKFSGLQGSTTYYNGGSSRTQQSEVFHGYNDRGVNTQVFSNVHDIRSISKVKFVVGVEHYDWVEKYVNDNRKVGNTELSLKLSTSGAPIMHEGQSWWAQFTRVTTELNGSKTTEDFYLDNVYHRVFAVCATGLDVNGQLKEGCVGDVNPSTNSQLITSTGNYDQRISNVESYTYDLGTDNRFQLLGFQSWFTQQKDTKERNTGYSTKTTTNIVGWLGLVVMDNSCLTCGNFPTTAPTPVISQGSAWNKFYVTWSNVGFSADYGLVIRYGTSQNNLQYSSKVALNKQRLDFDVPSDVAAGSYLYFELAFDSSCDHTVGLPASAYLIPDLSVGCAKITGIVSETSDSVTFSYDFDRNADNQPTSFEFWQKVNGVESKTGSISASQNQYKFTATNLKAGQSYEFQVRPAGPLGAATGCAWFQKSIAVAATCPNYLTIDGVSTGCEGFLLQWQTDYTSSNKKFYSYELQYAVGFVESWNTLQSSTTVMEKFVTSLSNQQQISGDLQYRFRIIGRAEGCDPFTSSPTNLLGLKAAIAPQLSFGQQDCSSIQLNWSGGSGVSSDWQLQYQTQNAGSWSNLLGSTAATYKFTEGTPGVIYSFRLIPSATSTLKSCGGAQVSSEVVQGSIASAVTPTINFVNTECDGVTIYSSQAIAGAQVYFKDLSAGSSWKQATLATGGLTNTNSVKILLSVNANLVAGREYYFQLRTVDGICGNANSNEYKAFVTQQQKPYFRATATCSSISFYSVMGLPTLTLEYRTSSGAWQAVSNWNQQSTLGSTSLSSINGQQVTSGSSYSFRLKSSNAQCGSSTSEVQTIFVPAVFKPTFTTDFTCDSVKINYSGYGNLQLVYRIANSGNEFVNVADWTPSSTGFVTVRQLSVNEVVSTGKSYEFKLRSTDSDVCAQDSAVSRVDIPASSGPSLKVTAKDCSSVQLDWTTGQGATGYKIEWVSENGQLVQVPTPTFGSGILTTTISQVGNAQLVNGNRYRFRITQQGACATTTADDEVLIPSGTSAPAITVTSQCSTATISWAAGAYGKLQLQQSSDRTNWSNVNQQITGKSVQVTGLTAGLTYWFRLENVDTICATTYSNQFQAPIQQPAASPYVYATTPTCNSIQLTWSNVAANDDFSIEYLSREASSLQTEVWTPVITKAMLPGDKGTNTQVIDKLGGNSLISGRMYTFRMLLKTTCETIYSRENAFVTMRKAVAPTLGVAGTCGQQTLSWNGGSSLEGQKIELYYTKASESNSWQLFPASVKASESFVVSDSGIVFENTDYIFKLKVSGGCGIADSNTVSVSFEGVAPAPTNLNFNLVGQQACIEYQQPATSATISSYNVQYQVDGGAWQQLSQTCSYSASNKCCFSQSLFGNTNFVSSTSCTKVAVKMQAVATCGTSSYSMTGSYSSSTLPNAPLVVRRAIGEYSNNRITVEWSEPEFDGCSPITHYKVYFSELPCTNYWTNSIYNFFPEFDWVIASSSVEAASRRFQLNSGVYQGERYAFSVEACNFNGCSSKSHAFTTVALNPPSQPLDGTTLSIGSDLMQVKWQKPIDNWNTVTSYRVEINEQMNNDARCFFQHAQATECVLLLDQLRAEPFNVQSGTSFDIRVYAVSHQGYSDASETFSAVMPAEKCDSQIVFAAVPDVAMVSQTEASESNDLPSFKGLEKDAKTADESAAEEPSMDDRVNLAAKTVFRPSATGSEDEGSAALFALGVAVTLVSQMFLLGGYFMCVRRKRDVELELPALAQEEATMNHSSAAIALEEDSERAGIAV